MRFATEETGRLGSRRFSNCLFLMSKPLILLFQEENHAYPAEKGLEECNLYCNTNDSVVNIVSCTIFLSQEHLSSTFYYKLAHFSDELLKPEETTQNKFFRYCNDNIKNYQLIIIDNKSPNEEEREILSNIHYIEFSESGRQDSVPKPTM